MRISVQGADNTKRSHEFTRIEGKLKGSFFEQQTDYVWSLAYIDALVLRDRDMDLNGSTEQRLYVQKDANFNVTALVGLSGSNWVGSSPRLAGKS